MTDACNCPTPVDAWCFARHRTDDGQRWFCTRRDSHDGPHSACVPDGEHPVVAWGDGG